MRQSERVTAACEHPTPRGRRRPWWAPPTGVWVPLFRALHEFRCRTLGAMPARPLPGNGPGPQPLGKALDAVMRGLGAPEASGVHLVFDRWAEVVGDSLAARTHPVKIDGGRLVLAVDEPAIATHVRFLQAELLARLAELLGPGRVTALDLRVGPKK